MTDEVTVAIAGGGIGGLALAAALRRDGHRVTVVERSPRIDDAGSGLILYPNAMKALDAISPRLGRTVRAAGHVARPGESRPLLSPAGETLSTDPVGELGRQYGAPHVSLLRSRLQRALLAEARAAGAELLPGVRVEDHADAGDGVKVVLDDGRTIGAHVLVGCDGINSVVRRRIVGDGPAPYRGFTTVRGRAPAPPGLPHGFVIKGPALDVFSAPIGGGHLYWTAKINAPAGTWPGKDPAAALSDLLERMSGWHDDVRSVVRGTAVADGVVITDIRDRDPVSRWSRGRVTLLGDAAHPMTPALGQGAGMSFEDCVVLAGCLRAEAGVDTALTAYAERRSERAGRMVRLSRAKGPAGEPTGMHTQDERLAGVFGWRPPRAP